MNCRIAANTCHASKPIARAVLLWTVCIGALSLSAPASSQQTSGVRSVQPVQTYDIPAGPLDQALNHFAGQAGILLAIEGRLTKGQTSSGLRGSYAVREALDQLLLGTGLEVVPQPDGGYTLVKGATWRGERLQLAPVTVLGSRQLDVPLSNVPTSITYMDRNDVRKEQATAERVEDVLSRRVPGFNPTNNGVRQIRGRTAQVFINGVPVNEQLRASGGSDLNLLSADQLSGFEVSRGANSAYGFGSPGGIIALSTPHAESEDLAMETRVRGSFNPHQPGGSYRASLYQSAAQILGPFDFHVGANLGYDGLDFAPDGDRALSFNSPKGIGNSKEFLSGFDTSLGYDLGDLGRLRLTGTFNYVDVTEGYDIDGLGIYREVESRIVRSEVNDNAFRRAFTVNAAYEQPDFLGSALKLELLASEIKTENLFLIDDRAVVDEQTNQYQGVRSSVNTPLGAIYEGLAATYGIDYLRNRYFRPARFEDNGEIFSFFAPDAVLESVAPYLQLEFPVGPFRLSGGVRHEKYFGHVDTAVGSGGVEGGDIRSFDLTLYNAGAVWALSDALDTFFSFSQGAEISQLGRAARNAGTADRIDPEPAKSNQYEIGFRGYGESLDWSLSAFYTESDLLSSLQFNPDDPNGPLIPLREPREFWGLEGALNWRINEMFGVGGTATWYDGIRERQSDGRTRRIDSRDVPPVLLAGYIDYFPYSWWRATLQADYRGGRDPFRDGDREPFMEGRVGAEFLLNLSSAIKLGPGELEIGVRNLLNEKYFSIPAEAGNSGFLFVPEEGTRVTVAYTLPWGY